jgi:Na+/proline symporter
MKLLPHGLIGFVVSAILSATLGQANDSFNWLAATLTRDVYAPVKERLTGHAPSDRTQLMTARAIMLVVGLLGIGVALYIPTLGGAFQFALVFYSLMAAFAMPVALGLLYTKTPWWSGMASCSAAIGAAVLLMIIDVWNEQAFVRNMLSESIVASSVFFASAFFYREEDPRNASIVAFARDLSTPALEQGKREVFAGLRVYSLIGRICFVLGGILIVCTFLPSTEVAPGVLNTAAGFMLLVIGGVAWFVARKAGPQPAEAH